MLNPKEQELYDRSWMERARKLLNRTQAEAAAECGISVGFYNRIERGVQMPNVKVGLTICKVLGVTPENWIAERRIA